MAWFGRDNTQREAEALVMTGFYASALAATDSYQLATERVEEGDVYNLFDKIRARHLDYADELRKRVKKLGRDPEDRTGVVEAGGRIATRIQTAGSVRDLLIAMRIGEENGVAMCREALEETDLSGKSRSVIESYNRAHIDNIRDLSEQIALRGTYAGTAAELFGPQWLRYPKPAFWLFEGAILLIGYLFGRRGGSSSASSGSETSGGQSGRTSPREQLGGEQAAKDYGETLGRELGK